MITSPSLRRRAAFSLIELLVVVAIMAVLMVIVAPSTLSLIRSSNMTRAASTLNDELNAARQAALTRSRDVEVRFYQLGSKSNASDTAYRAMRAFLVDGTDATKSQPLTPLRYLVEPIIISEDPKFSTLLDYTNASRSGLTHLTETLPGGTVAPYVSFMFRANGGTNLKPVALPVGNWYLTVLVKGAPNDATTGLPANYFTLQIDPVTGRTRTYRP